MRAQLFAAVRAIVVLTVLTGVAYPLVVTGIAQAAFGDKADGSLVHDEDGDVVGSSLLGQEFSSAHYFHGRPSAAGAAASGSLVDGEPADPDDLSVVASGASNLGPTNDVLLDTVEERAAAYREENGLAVDDEVPVDAVTASGSGVDPDISVANARLQAPRVAAARGLSLDRVLALVGEHTSGRSLGFLGEKAVNVLELNLALDREGHSSAR
jgi:potassium-transporting ATPase KdpC subunit